MSSFRIQPTRKAIVVATTLLAAFASGGVARATIVGAQSYGDELENARIQVFFQNAGVRAATVVVGGLEQGVADDPGFFNFQVTGDTFLADWQLTNQTSNDFIDAVVIDLGATTSQDDLGNMYTPGVLFDDNSLPSTANGYAGRQGAVQVNVGAPFIINSGEIVPWTDVMNAGDEFVVEEIFYEAFGPGLTSVWRDDTDIVGTDTGPELPEPTSAALLLMAGCGWLARNRPRA